MDETQCLRDFPFFGGEPQPPVRIAGVRNFIFRLLEWQIEKNEVDGERSRETGRFRGKTK